MEHLKALLVEGLKKSGKSQNTIARETGIKQSSVNRIINHKEYMSLERVGKIGIALGMEKKAIAEAWKQDKTAELNNKIAEFLAE
jgi:plasmid maintenance system antidote protein VapI